MERGDASGSRDGNVSLLVGRSNTLVQTEISYTLKFWTDADDSRMINLTDFSSSTNSGLLAIYLQNYWMDCYEIWYGYPPSLEDES